MRLFKTLVLSAAFALSGVAAADEAKIAAAADLKYAFNEIKAQFEKKHPEHKLEIIMGSSGKFTQQIENGAPYDVFFSADVNFPKKLVASGKAIEPVTTYAFGRVVLWSPKVDASKLTLADLTKPEFRKIAIAAPDHAPYGQRAKEALEHAKVWDKIENKIVYGENISHTAQLIDTQAAEIGIIALSLALNDKLKSKGGYYLIPGDYHKPLEQAYVVTKHGENNKAALAFAEFMRTEDARKIMRHYGFVLPGEKVE
ncbi:MAG: molybdate ABC transporter substrate-binding protein [Halothiobacillaceae bacterium]